MRGIRDAAEVYFKAIVGDFRREEFSIGGRASQLRFECFSLRVGITLPD
jgi:hypothetical protein